MVNLELSIFKIKDDAEIEEIISKIRENQENKYESRYLEKDVQLNNKKYSLKFFFYINQNSGATIDWYTEISSLFQKEEVIQKSVYSGYGILLIYCDEFKYVFTFGRATYLLSKYIDWDFGLEMAAKMLDKNSINAQSSKFFSTSKNKSLIVYNKGRFNPEAGESFDLINATISEAEKHSTIRKLCNYISTKVGFSSGLKIVVSMEEITIKDIVDIMILMNMIYIKYENRLNIPKLLFIKPTDEIIVRLNQKLNEDIIKDENINISLNMYAIIDSEITLLDNITKYRLICNRNNREYNVLDINNIKEFMMENKINNIEDVKLKIFYNDMSRNLNILKIIDYTTELDNENAYFCLYDGRWAKFNIDYVEQVDQNIEEINREIVCFDSRYDLSYKELEEIREKEGKELLNILTSTNVEVNEETLGNLYREFIYNYKLVKEEGGKLLDRKRYKDIEICDIYNKRELIHTKIGSPGDYNECINQSINGFEIWNLNKERVRENLGIKDVKTVTLLLITNNKKVLQNKNIKEFKSLRFKLNLIDWQRQINEYGKNAKVIIGELKE